MFIRFIQNVTKYGYPRYINVTKMVVQVIQIFIRGLNDYPFYPMVANCYPNEEKLLSVTFKWKKMVIHVIQMVIHFIRTARKAYPKGKNNYPRDQKVLSRLY